jgi:CRP-like cAMP-binding protein
VTTSAYAVGEVTVLQIERDTLEQLVFRTPELLQDLSRAIDDRRARAREAATAEEPTLDFKAN